MTRSRGFILIISLLFIGCLSADPASAINPFAGKEPLDLQQGTSVNAADSADKKARIGSHENDEKAVTLAVMADLHAKAASLPLLQRAIARVNALDSIIGLAIVGDLCSKLGTRAEYDVLSRGLKGLAVPAYAVPGNHDILYKDNLVNGEKKRGTPAEKKAKHELFKKTLKLKSLYYARKAGGHLLVFLPNDTLSGIPCVLPSDDAFEFLRKTLRENRNLPTIIFCHAPLAGSYGDKKTMPPIQANAQPARKIQRILAENPQVYLWFAGHLHITPSQKYYNSPENKVGKVTVIHVPPAQIHSSWIQTVRLSSKGAVVRTMDVKSGRFLKKHTRVFKPTIKKDSSQDEPAKIQNRNDSAGDEKFSQRARIVITNAHAGGNHDRNGFGNWLADLEPDVALVSEAVGMPVHLRPAGRVFNAGSETKGRQEVAVVVRDGLKVMAHDSGKISPDLQVGIAHDRWWSRVSTRVAGVKSRVYSIHLNAVIQNHDGHPVASKRWDVTREGLVGLERQLREDIKAGWGVIIGGDFNWNDSRTHAQSHRMAPGRILKRLGMTYVNNELMWLAWTPKTHTAVRRLSTPPTKIPGLYAGEHPALRIDLKGRIKTEDDEPDKEEEKHDTSDEESPDIDEEEPVIDDSELEPAEAETSSDDELIESAEPASTEEDAVSSETTTDAEESESDVELPETTATEADPADNAEESDNAGAATDEAGSEAATASDSAGLTDTQDDTEQAAIERIRELIAEIYEQLLKTFSAFTSLLGSKT